MSNKKRLVPELRFPEFENVGGWETDSLGNLVEIKGRIGYRGYTRKDIVEKGKGAITLSPSNFDENGKLNFEKCTYITWAKYYESPEIMLEEGQTVLVKTASVGKSAYVENLPEKVTVNPQIVVLKPKKIEPKFLAYTIFHNYVQTQIKSSIGAGAIPNMSQASISNFGILLPPDEEWLEQQKIADCLSSLDALIAAHRDKLDALRAHKKGLMQNLFLQEGERVPRYRFEGFVGVWEEKKLGEMTTKVGSGKTPKGGDKNYVSSGRPFVRSQNIGWGILLLEDIAFINEETHSTFLSSEIELNDVLLNITGASIGRSAIANEKIVKGNVNQHVCIIRTKNALNPVFLNQYLISQYGQRQIDSFQAGGNRQGLNFSQIRSLVIPTPSTKKEQQKIAECLSAVDELIAAQADRIEQLQEHKRGLMQGLFPNPNTQ